MWHALSRRPLVIAGALAALALYLAHVRSYGFLTDDAFISFRYARNLAEGHGLVFNAGHERVEGYTNFLWVVLLASLARLGVAPERIANVLSVACGIAVWFLVLRASVRDSLRDARPAWILLAPVVLLASTRSFAVWTTSGLETKLYELFVVAGTLRAIDEVASARAGGRESWIGSSLLLALAALTRPDGALIAAGVLGARYALERPRGAARRPAVAAGAGLLVALLSAHLIFRLAYYGDWVPNTYHAKVGGRTWWAMGARYAIAFALEYGVVFWVPLMAAAYGAARRAPRDSNGAPAPSESGPRVRLALFAAATLPHALYVLSIGGDHFEYRPLDVLFPFAFLVLADGAAALAAPGTCRDAGTIAGDSQRRGPVLAAALLFLALANAALAPLLGRLDFPRDYRAGFPGWTPRADGTQDLISEKRFPALVRAPLVGPVIRRYNDLIAEMTAHSVGIRQEEHALFIPGVVEDGTALARLVAEGALPPDVHIATGAVGAIPYTSGLRTLDRLGLTDRVVARGPSAPAGLRMMAHDKAATVEYATAQGVDLWAVDNTHFVFGPDESRLREFAKAPLVAARTGADRFLIAALPQDSLRSAARLPRMTEAVAYFTRLAGDSAATWWACANLGDLLAGRGGGAGAIAAYEKALRIAPDAARAEHHLGALLAERGDAENAIAHLRRAVALEPSRARARFDLGLALVNRGDLAEAFRLLREGAAAAPSEVAMSAVLARFLAVCPDSAFRDPAQAVQIAERLRRLTRGGDPYVLDTLATAYASTARFADARRAAERAVAIARSYGNESLAREIQERADRYAAGRAWF